VDGEWACELVRCIEITSPNHCRSKWLSFDPYMRLLMVQTDLALDFAHLSVVEDAMQGTLPPPPKIHPSPPYTHSPPRPPAPSKHILPRPPLHPLTGVFAADGGDEAEENELEDGQGSGGFAEAAVIALLGDE